MAFSKQSSHCQACYNKFLFCFDYNYKIVYRSGKTINKLNVLIKISEIFFKKDDDFNKRNFYLYWIIIKKKNINS